VNWEPCAGRLAAGKIHPASRWRPVVASVPRHVFVPRWWVWSAPGPGLWHDTWELRDGPADPDTWLDAAYCDRSLITRVGLLHADHATPGDRPTGLPTSSATLPSLLVRMYRHAMITDGMDVLDVGTGSGYGTALLATRLSDTHVTSVDLDEYLAKAAAERLDSIGLHPDVRARDATGPLPGTYDRIVATVAVRPVPASWLAALRPGGRLVTTITGTNLIITADKTSDGGASGRTEWDRAGFMHARSGPDYPPAMLKQFTAIRDAEGDQVSTGSLPVVNVNEAWDLYSTLGVIIPGIQHHYEEDKDGKRTAWIIHPDGSWARATGTADQAPVIHQTGPRHLWNTLDELRQAWLRDGSLPAYGAKVTIEPDGTIHLSRGRWQATIPQADSRGET
jgi:protein-L-isoaspartate O-methyltransferase